MHEHFCSVIYKEIVTESLAITDMTAITGAVPFRFESKFSGFHVLERLFKVAEAAAV